MCVSEKDRIGEGCSRIHHGDRIEALIPFLLRLFGADPVIYMFVFRGSIYISQLIKVLLGIISTYLERDEIVWKRWEMADGGTYILGEKFQKLNGKK